MKVKTLIEKLKSFDQNAEICIQESTMMAKKVRYIREIPAYLHPEIGVYYFTNKNRKDYKEYGGRGIKCLITEEELKELWFRDKAYLMTKPSIDREDNNGHYEFLNCSFIELSKNIAKGNKERHLKRIIK